MQHKDTYFICICDDDSSPLPGGGIGEAALFRGLSCDDLPDYEQVLQNVCRDIEKYAASPELLADYPSIRFGVETALLDYRSGGRGILFDTPWSRGEDSLTINGLIWMGDADLMRKRIAEKLKMGFTCIKIKIGGIDFEQEIRLLDALRNEAPEVTLRLDANGAFDASNALERLNLLSRFSIHSIEQPVKAGSWELMRTLCQESPIPIALDEELIGLNTLESKITMLEEVRPRYIVLKPSLCGGISGTREWISLAGERGCGWWITSALESDIGLCAIAQFTSTFNPTLPQGLGTGQLFSNNIPSTPLSLSGEKLSFNPQRERKLPSLTWK